MVALPECQKNTVYVVSVFIAMFRSATVNFGGEYRR